MLKKTFLNSLSLFFSAYALVSCQSGQRAQPIEPPAALDQLNTFSEHTQSSAIDEIPNNWWVLFKDHQLDHLIDLTFKNNPTLQKASANVHYVQAQAEQIKSFLYPHLFLGGDISRQKLSKTGIIPFNKNTSGIQAATSGEATGALASTPGLLPGAGVPLIATGGVNSIPVYFTQYETELTLTYEFDIWGKNRKRWLAAIGDIKARLADKAFIELNLGISVAQLYYQLQINYRRKAFAEIVVENREKRLKLIEKRLKGNLDSLSSVEQAKNELAIDKQFLYNLDKSIAVDYYQLQAYVAGDFQEPVLPIEIEKTTLPVLSIPENLSLHLIARRPDITAQLWLIESASKQIEIAKIGFYPDFNLFALFGYQTLHLRKLFQWKSSDYNIDPAFTLPIFDAGRLLGILRESEANYDSVIYDYNQLVLDATQDVLTHLAILKESETLLKEFQEQVNYQEKILNLIQLRVSNHLDSALTELTQEREWALANDLELTALGDTIKALLFVIKSLGGGYDPCTY